ncbi:MAG: DNA primase [Alphaproteobacteria bacterium]|nr:DNA primase [Alphaproteobacteria bacterium]
MANTDLQKFCDELRAKISIADVVGQKVKLTRKGREHTGLCPFHNEKTPSFTVNEAKGFYHCFGCGAHGDIIKFEMDANGLTFIDAVEKLAHKVGMQLPKLNAEAKEVVEKRNTAYDIMEMAAKFFEKNLRLTGGREALDYLYARGFDDNIISKFRLGFAPNNNGLKAQLSSKGVSEQEMAELGLLTIPEGKRSHDFFRNRVMIPIIDKRGKVIAFGGRVMDGSQPKYLNSPETPVFNKRRVLYNLNNARDAGYDAKCLIICEGYMDVIAMDKYGIGYAVAPLGTALTEDQIAEAWKVVQEPICCFDGDGAGVRAAIRSVDRVLPILKPGFSLKYAFLPDKQDPDEFLKMHGQEEFLKVINDTMPLKDLLWKKNADVVQANTPEQKALLEKNIRDEVAKIADETVRGYYAQDMKTKIYHEIGRGAAWQKTKFEGTSSYKRKNERATISLVGTVRTNLDDLVAEYVISALICYPQLIEEYEEKLLDFQIKSDRLRRLYEYLLELAHEGVEIETSEALQHILCDKGFDEELKNRVDLKMLFKQCPDIMLMRKNLDDRIVEVQLRQLEMDIRECMRQMQTGDSFSEETFSRYESLKKEREALLASQNDD